MTYKNIIVLAIMFLALPLQAQEIGILRSVYETLPDSFLKDFRENPDPRISTIDLGCQTAILFKDAVLWKTSSKTIQHAYLSETYILYVSGEKLWLIQNDKLIEVILEEDNVIQGIKKFNDRLLIYSVEKAIGRKPDKIYTWINDSGEMIMRTREIQEHY